MIWLEMFIAQIIAFFQVLIPFSGDTGLFHCSDVPKASTLWMDIYVVSNFSPYYKNAMMQFLIKRNNY